jgi:hypothetical protein
MRRHRQNKQPVGAFRIHDGTIVDGRDQLPVLLQTADRQPECVVRPRQRVLRTVELADGWYEVFRDGTVRGPVQSAPDVPPSPTRGRPVLRRIRSSPTIRAKRTILTLYGQIG